MWNKTNEKDRLPNFPYRIICSTVEFAKYWNRNYANIYQFRNEKDPKIKPLAVIPDEKYLPKLISLF